LNDVFFRSVALSHEQSAVDRHSFNERIFKRYLIALAQGYLQGLRFQSRGRCSDRVGEDILQGDDLLICVRRSGKGLMRALENDLPTGTEIAVLTNQTIDSSTASVGQTFSADVANNVMDEYGHVVIPKGSAAELVLRGASRSGVTSNAELALDLQSIRVGNRRYLVDTQDLEERASGGLGANKRTAEMVGGGAALGTLIGAIAGGGKGAAIGAVAGAGAGAGTQILTRGKSVKVPAETTLRFRLDQPLGLQAAY